MKKWILMTSALCALLIPFSLKASEPMSPDDQCKHCEEYCSECSGISIPLSSIPLSSIPFDPDEDYSEVLGSEAFVDYLYRFFDRTVDFLADMNKKGRQLIALYPEEPVSLQWKRDLDKLSPFLAERNKNMKLACFTGFGAYKASKYQDDETLSQFKDLQNQIFVAFIQDLFLLDALQRERIDEETFYERLEKIESDIMTKMHTFCVDTKDSFFAIDVPDFLSGATSRLEVLERTISFDEEEDDFDGETQAEMAFEDLEDAFADQLGELIIEMFSPQAMLELSSNVRRETTIEDTANEIDIEDALGMVNAD